ncbi:hypothetical protein ACRS85_23275 [Pluralibacter gergoviae]|uniref:hypothetical protein n=1 Tax=Pluralibacter gergoviae TaxID=61647 RepID=UPI003EE0A346
MTAGINNAQRAAGFNVLAAGKTAVPQHKRCWGSDRGKRMKIEISKVQGQICLLISPVKISVADRLATAMENSEVIAAFGAYFTASGEAPSGELVGVYLYFNNLDTAALITLSHLVEADEPIPVIVW